MSLSPENHPERMYDIEEGKILKFQKALIDKWKPESDVWSLKYGDVIIGCSAAICGIVINSIFRRKLKLRFHQGSVFTATMIASGTALTSYLGHKIFVTDKLLILQTECLLCKELRAVTLIQGTSLLHPLITAPAINIYIAGIEGYRVPYIIEVKELLKFWWSIVRPASRTLLLLFLGNIVTGGIVCYFQFKSIEKISEILTKVQRHLEEEEAMAVHEMAAVKI